MASTSMIKKKGALAHLFIPPSIGPVSTVGLTGVAALAAHGGQRALFPNRRLTVETINTMTSPNVGQFRSDVWADFGLATVLSGVIGVISQSILPALAAEAVGIYHLASRLQKISEVEKRGTV